MKRAVLAYLNRPPSRIENGWVVLAFFLMLWQLGSPGGITMIPEVNLSTIVRSPLSALIHIHVIGVLFPLILAFFAVGMFASFGAGSTSYEFSFIEAFYHFPFNAFVASLWLFLFWSWLLKLTLLFWRSSCRWQSFVRHWRSPRWWVLPILSLTLCGLWATRLPLSVTFQLAKPTLEQVANEVVASPDGILQLSQSKRAGPFAVSGAYHLDEKLDWGAVDKTPSIDASEQNASVEILGFWVHQGFMRDKARYANESDRRSFGLVSGSSGTDEVFYLGDGWYAFQNYLD